MIPVDVPRLFDRGCILIQLSTLCLQRRVQFSVNLDVTSYKNGVRETHNPDGRANAPVVWDYYQVQWDFLLCHKIQSLVLYMSHKVTHSLIYFLLSTRYSLWWIFNSTFVSNCWIELHS